jgi:hypothetical protein
VAKSLPTEESQLPFPTGGNLSKAAQAVLDDTASSNKLAGLKDPDMTAVEDMAKHLSEGKDATGNALTASPKEAESLNRAFNSKIDALESKAEQGGNATALRHLKNLKTAFNDDLFDAYEKYGDPDAAKSLRTANKEYAKIVSDQTYGPARGAIKSTSPEKIVSNIVSGGAKSQSQVESLMKNMSKEGQSVLRDSALKEIYRKNTLPDGTIDMTKARKAFYGMGDTAKALFGDKLQETSQFLDAAAKHQAKLEAAAQKTPIAQTILTKTAKAIGAGEGASIGGVPGAVAGYALADAATDALFQQGKSGAVKIGISPTEKIVLSPADAIKKRPLITKFLQAKASGKAAAVTSAYNVRKTYRTSKYLGGLFDPTTPQYAKPGPYFTKLTPSEEENFQAWVKAKKVPWQDTPTADYDMRGYWKSLVAGDPNAKQKKSDFDGKMHFPDTYKTPYHKTFSNESKYATSDAPHWEEDRLIDKDGGVVADETPKGIDKILDESAANPKNQNLKNDAYQAIIRFRKESRSLPEEERGRLQKKISEYSNNLHGKSLSK